MKKQIAVLGIIVKNRRENACCVNDILTDYGHLILGRLGIPYESKNESIISLIVDATAGQIEELTNKLEAISGVTAKAVVAE